MRSTNGNVPSLLRISRLSVLCASVLGLGLVFCTYPAASEDARTYSGQKLCKLCHNKPMDGAQWKVWSKMKHASAFKALSSPRALEIAKERKLEKPPSESAECLKCHVTGYDVDAKKAPSAIKVTDGVQCESCHGPASAHVADGPKLKMAKGNFEGLDLWSKIDKPNKDTCLKCHNKENPTWDPKRYTLENGETADFDFEQAYAKIAHQNPNKKAK